MHDDLRRSGAGKGAGHTLRRLQQGCLRPVSDGGKRNDLAIAGERIEMFFSLEVAPSVPPNPL